jgi:hypothetical protein
MGYNKWVKEYAASLIDYKEFAQVDVKTSNLDK